MHGNWRGDSWPMTWPERAGDRPWALTTGHPQRREHHNPAIDGPKTFQPVVVLHKQRIRGHGPANTDAPEDMDIMDGASVMLYAIL